jgi:hypothetical protein
MSADSCPHSFFSLFPDPEGIWNFAVNLCREYRHPFHIASTSASCFDIRHQFLYHCLIDRPHFDPFPYCHCQKA